jgi:hypothetical protein
MGLCIKLLGGTLNNVYASSFIAHAIETAWAVKVPTDKNTTLDYKNTGKVARVATAMMILGFFLLFAGVIARGVSAGRVPWEYVRVLHYRCFGISACI